MNNYQDDEEKEYVVPGYETTAWSEGTLPHHRAYWFIQCPERECGKIHPRIVTQYWQDESPEDGGFEPHAVEQHCFYCDTTGRHFKINRDAPFNIIFEIPMPVLKAEEPDIDDDGVIAAFE